MASNYPTGLDALPTNRVDGSSVIPASDHNDVADATNKIEAELGLTPKGAFATVRERFEAMDLKQSCRAANARGVNVSLTAPGGTMDGVTLGSGDRILLKDQTTASQNGIYVWTGAAATLTRAGDADTAAKLNDTTIVTVEQGTENRDTVWELTTDNPITLGTTGLRITRISPPYQDQNQMSPWAVVGGAQPVLLENIGRAGVVNIAMLTSGQIQCLGVAVLQAGRPCNGVSVWSGSTAGATLTNSWAGFQSVYSGQAVAVTSNDTTATLAAGARRRWAFASAFTPDQDLPVRVFAMFAGTTVPSLMGVQGISGTPGIQNAAPQITGRDATTGRTTPIAVGTALTFATADHRTGWFGID